MTRRPRVAITAHDITGATYSGMGLRYVGLARALGEHADVNLLTMGDPQLDAPGVTVAWDQGEHAISLRTADYVVTPNAVRIRQLPLVSGRLLYDLYDPSIFEWLSQPVDVRSRNFVWARNQLHAFRTALRAGDYFLCANVRQRDLYLGAALAIKGSRWTLRHDETLLARRFLVVPNGVEEPHLPDRRHARRRLGFHDDETVFLWGGGLWDWLDPFMVADAVRLARSRGAAVRAFFLGLRRDGTDPNATLASGFVDYCRRLGVWQAGVSANEEWVSSRDRWQYLAAADFGLLAARSKLETHFSFRTRYVDCLSAGLPVLATGGDSFGEAAEREGWGMLTQPGEVGEMATAMEFLGADAPSRARMRESALRAKDGRRWADVSAPLCDLVTANNGDFESRSPLRSSAVFKGAGHVALNRLRVSAKAWAWW